MANSLAAWPRLRSIADLRRVQVLNSDALAAIIEGVTVDNPRPKRPSRITQFSGRGVEKAENECGKHRHKMADKMPAKAEMNATLMLIVISSPLNLRAV